MLGALLDAGFVLKNGVVFGPLLGRLVVLAILASSCGSAGTAWMCNCKKEEMGWDLCRKEVSRNNLRSYAVHTVVLDVQVHRPDVGVDRV